MKALNNMRTATKLIGSFLIIAILAGVVGVLGIFFIRKIDNADTNLYENYTVPISQLETISTHYQRIRVNLREAIIDTVGSTDQVSYDKIDDFFVILHETALEYEALIETAEMREIFEVFNENLVLYEDYSMKIIELDKKGRTEEAIALMRGDAFASAEEVKNTIAQMTEMKVSQAHDIAAQNTASANQATTIMIIIIFFYDISKLYPYVRGYC